MEKWKCATGFAAPFPNGAARQQMDAEHNNKASRVARLQGSAFRTLYPPIIDTIAGKLSAVARVTRSCDARGAVACASVPSRFDLHRRANRN